MKKIKIILLLFLSNFLTLTIAGIASPVMVLDEEIDNNTWSVTASTGYSEYQSMFRDDGKSVIGRFAIATELLATSRSSFGLEVGIQNGKHMRFVIPTGPFDALGGTIQTTMMPMLDLLVTANSSPVMESLLFTQLKGGIIYRRWQLENAFINNKSEISGEVQAGFGYPLTEMASLNLLYQGIFGGSPKLSMNSLTELWQLAKVPTQHGFLFGFSIIV